MARLRSAPVAVLTMLTLAAAPAFFATSPAGAAEEARDHHRAGHQRRRRGGARDRRPGGGAAHGEEHQGRGGRAGDEPERHRWKHHAGHARHAAGDDRERLHRDRGAGLPGRHRDRRARPVGREAERGDVGHQRRSEPGQPQRPLGNGRRGTDGTEARAPRGGVQPGPRCRAAVRQHRQARGRLAGQAPRRVGEEAEDRADDTRQLQRAELPVGQVAGREDRDRPRRTPTARSPAVDCTATGPKPTTDIEAFNQGYAAVAPVSASR